MKLRQEIRLLPTEINIQPAPRILQQRMRFRLCVHREGAAEIFLTAKPQTDDGIVIAGEDDAAGP